MNKKVIMSQKTLERSMQLINSFHDYFAKVGNESLTDEELLLSLETQSLVNTYVSENAAASKE